MDYYNDQKKQMNIIESSPDCASKLPPPLYIDGGEKLKQREKIPNKLNKRSSLTIDESNFLSLFNEKTLQWKSDVGKKDLEILQSIKNDHGDDDVNSDEEEPEFKLLPHRSIRLAREKLRASIVCHETELSDAACEFLKCVADSDASEEALLKANNVLLFDMSQNGKGENSMGEDKKKIDTGIDNGGVGFVPILKKSTYQRRKSSFIARSFRIEMHEGLLCAPPPTPEHSILKVEQKSEIQDHHLDLLEDADVNPFLMFTFQQASLRSLTSYMKEEEEKSQRHSSFGGSMRSIRTNTSSRTRGTIGSIAELDEEEEEEDAYIKLGKVDFLVLGASKDQNDIKNHVLSPALMHVLRPFMPFAVREDNFWMKYSLIHDVSVFC
uniref:Uncharacterized protein n=1 Tax=Ditylum brightwellii TaxID=49249 RepID=A0A6V2FPK1_9STRA|mmetsp:Transcript_2541/g.4008  ORF Transcript_2541/g.4008 Transcript_2541/m.4008 type:complete len:381 (-) Transcript_2541:1235-2377(-)